MQGDPYWTTARFQSTCKGCGGQIKKGARIFYYPRTRQVFCDSENCGKHHSRDFESARFDEGMMSGNW